MGNKTILETVCAVAEKTKICRSQFLRLLFRLRSKMACSLCQLSEIVACNAEK